MESFLVIVSCESPEAAVEAKESLEAAGIPTAGRGATHIVDSTQEFEMSSKITARVEADSADAAITEVHLAVGTGPSVGPARPVSDGEYTEG